MRYDGAKVVYPNPKMNADMVVNLNRSGNRNESVKVFILFLSPDDFPCILLFAVQVYTSIQALKAQQWTACICEYIRAVSRSHGDKAAPRELL